MRNHFHRCGHLRVIAVEASELNAARKGGSQILEELCQARRLARCVGLAECDVLSPAQKRNLLAARATRLRGEEGGSSALGGESGPRSVELEDLRGELLEELEDIVADNRRRRAEAAAALQRNPRPIARGEEGELVGPGVSIFLDDELRELHTARLDAIERALDAMAAGRFGDCVRCHRPIEVERLREAPDTAVCAACATRARPDPDQFQPAWAEPLQGSSPARR
jgi:RNA polymerase-binding transcription factor DksA